ncbi:type 1 glutamine amidotransferase [Thiorhodovibrio frisius]|uniref:GMP synthase family protein n=1 Tax=Thiorhodovibrio frisius TaxID=631362 RepID=H8YX09_9GAMM|nr:type 1 glutamine amidotransferase [Thiorhodovibrio frisius]EIC22985.1 GMP synthase family protein [Thiorhodovibrio frisius]WPL22748.1 GMP synthase [glutamine-hydrolyzing] [Thiorhodovibrio frisius]
MRLHVLQHVPFEGPARIGDWAGRRGHALATSHLYAGDPPPALEDFDGLVIMGGPMSVHDEAEHSWLGAEKACIENAIAAGRPLIGVCLGAQLIAQALGAAVTKNAEREIGWFPIELTAEAQAEPCCAGLPARFDALHWHGERFDIPAGALHLARSQACDAQAFLYQGRVLGLQCHLESMPGSVAALCEHCADELSPGPFVQTAGEMCAAPPAAFEQVHAVLEQLLDAVMPSGGPA